ncbi:MAG: hypothetical protein Fur005_23830 [Roseiflexaceae bacterium]
MPNPTIELVEFRLKEGVPSASFLAAVEASQAAVQRLPGFISRELSCSDEGLWIDLVHWRSHADAVAAAEAFGSLPEVAAFAAMIDMQQMRMLHLAQQRSF